MNSGTTLLPTSCKQTFNGEEGGFRCLDKKHAYINAGNPVPAYICMYAELIELIWFNLSIYSFHLSQASKFPCYTTADFLPKPLPIPSIAFRKRTTHNPLFQPSHLRSIWVELSPTCLSACVLPRCCFPSLSDWSRLILNSSIRPGEVIVWPKIPHTINGATLVSCFIFVTSLLPARARTGIYSSVRRRLNSDTIDRCRRPLRRG